MLNEHTGLRLNHHTGKEMQPKVKVTHNITSAKKAPKKYRCRTCGKKSVWSVMIEYPADKHGRYFLCKKCSNLNK